MSIDRTCIFALPAGDAGPGPAPDAGAMPTEDLRASLHALTAGEALISHRRRLLHTRIDVLRAELVKRLREEGGR